MEPAEDFKVDPSFQTAINVSVAWKESGKVYPFTYTGLDYLGPLYAQDGTSKRVCLGMSLHLCHCQGNPPGVDPGYDSRTVSAWT